MFPELCLANQQTSQRLTLRPSFKIAHSPAEAGEACPQIPPPQPAKEAFLSLHDAHRCFFVISAPVRADASAWADPRLHTQYKHSKLVTPFRF